MNDNDIPMPTWAECPPEEMQRIISTLYRVHRLFSNMTDFESLLTLVMDEGRKVAHAEASWLLLCDPETEELYFEVALGESGNQEVLKQEVRLKLGQGIAGLAALERRTVEVADAQQDPQVFLQADVKSAFQTRNLLAVPLMDRDELVGVIEVLNKADGGTFTETDSRVLEMFASLAAASIRNAQLIEANLKSAQLVAIGTAVTGVSHYAKNVITGLTTSVELIDTALETNNDSLLRKSWPVLRRSTRRLSHMVQDMLSFSKARRPLLDRCGVQEVFDDVRETYADLFARRDIDVVFDASHAAEKRMLDQEALYRALLNLVNNAADAVPPHGGQVRVQAALVENQLEVTVDDNGPGVSAENMEKIWDPFFSTKGNHGTGLGLAVSRKLVRELNGDLEVETSPLGGARFRIRVPAHVATEFVIA